MDNGDRLRFFGRIELIALAGRQERIIRALLREIERAEERYATEHRRQADQLADYRVRIRRLGGKLPGRQPISQVRDTEKVSESA